MKAETIKREILQKFGKKTTIEQLDKMLCSLVNASGGTIEPEKIEVESKEYDTSKIQRYLSKNLKLTIENIISCNKTHYEKCELILDTYRFFGGWHHVTTIPISFVRDIFEMFGNEKHGILFDDTRNNEYIRVK